MQPDPRIVDFLGRLAHDLRETLMFPNWEVSSSRVDLRDVKTGRHAFVSHMNYGYEQTSPRDCSQFVSGATETARAIQKVIPPGTRLVRIGVKQQWLLPYTGSFENLMTLFERRYGRASGEVLEALGGRLIDIGLPVWCEDKIGMLKTMAGPMRQEQAKNFISDPPDALPDVGFYFEIDYFVFKPDGNLDRQAFTLLNSLARGGEERWQKIERLMFGQEL